MDSIKHIIDLFLHVDKHLLDLVQTYGVWAYGILFAVVFMETGLVVTPFLPGDSLLFAAGALAGAGALEIRILVPLLIAAAVIGDNLNYLIGRHVVRRGDPESGEGWTYATASMPAARARKSERAPWIVSVQMTARRTP